MQAKKRVCLLDKSRLCEPWFFPEFPPSLLSCRMAGTRRTVACTKQLQSRRLPRAMALLKQPSGPFSLPSAAARLARMLNRTRSCDSMMPLYRRSPPQAISACLSVPTRVMLDRHALSFKRTCHHSCTCAITAAFPVRRRCWRSSGFRRSPASDRRTLLTLPLSSSPRHVSLGLPIRPWAAPVSVGIGRPRRSMLGSCGLPRPLTDSRRLVVQSMSTSKSSPKIVPVSRHSSAVLACDWSSFVKCAPRQTQTASLRQWHCSSCGT